MRFFSFPEIQTDTVSLTMPGRGGDLDDAVIHGKAYYLAKDRFVETAAGKVTKERNNTLKDPDLMKVTYEIDPNVSMVKDENVLLAHYLKDQHLQIEIYDADAKFHFASCKLPLSELLRQ